MAATSLPTKYLNAKYSFLSSYKPTPGKHPIEYSNTRLKSINYPYVAKYLPHLEHDLNDLFEVLKQDNKHPEKFWLYAFYCAKMLETYYIAYDEQAQVKKYQVLAQEIECRFQQTVLPFEKNQQEAEDKQSDFERIKTLLVQDLTDILFIPRHSSKIKEVAGLTNITRMQIVFGKIVVGTSLAMIKESQQLNLWFGASSIDKMLANLDKPAGALNILSVAVFAVRFVMNAGHVLKHTFFPGDMESNVSLSQRFSQELSKCHVELVNDFAWGTVNLFTNYAQYFGVSATAAATTMSIFLVFDLSLLFYRRYLAQKEYLALKEQYCHEKSFDLNDEKYSKILDAQLQLLESRWAVTDATLWFNISAATLLMTGFSAAMTLNSPVVVPAAFVVCTLAISMYVSSPQYSAYKQQALILQEKENHQVASDDFHREVTNARHQLYMAMGKNAVVPIVFMGVFAVSIPATILLTASYISYELCKGYVSHLDKNNDGRFLVTQIDTDREAFEAGEGHFSFS